MHTPRNEKWRERLVRSGYFFGALFFHLVLFLMVATWVIWKAPLPPPTDEFHSVAVEVPPPPPQPPSSGGAAANPQFEPQSVVVPVATPSSMITTVNSAFKIDTSKVMDQTLSHLSDQMAQSTGLSLGGGGTTGTGTAFGSSTGSGTLLTGYFIDFKQTSDKKPTGMNVDDYLALLAKYISQGWDDSMLEPFYKAKAPLYTDVYAISTRLSEEAPKAFGVEKEVQPGLWAVHYHARVQAPQAGEYRFAGFGDNILVVKIRGEIVLDAGYAPLLDKPFLHKDLPFAFSSYGNPESPFDSHLKQGPAFHLDSADPVDMDVLIGDDGGVCSYFLLIEREGNTYEMMPDGTPKLPFFQISTKDAPTFSDKEEHPPYSTTIEPWTGAPN